jgi:DNA-binding NtrC family response regulator
MVFIGTLAFRATAARWHLALQIVCQRPKAAIPGNAAFVPARNNVIPFTLTPCCNAVMAPIAWRGPPPSAALRASLEHAGIALAHEGEPEHAGVVVCTADARAVPQPGIAGRPWIWVCERAVRSEAVTQAVLGGAYDVIALPTPDAPERLARRLGEILAPDPVPVGAPGFVAESEAGRRLLARIARAARTSMPVLLTGETGTGKEVAAQLIHTWSARAARRFVPINCAATPNELMEAELFGYAKGAFSGAVRGFEGRLMAAEGGTVFLDEIDDTPLSTQVKLLRVLEDRVVTRLGESAPHNVDFRLVAATNRDLRALIESGAFGADLFERLAIVSIRLPPLRERIDDLPALVLHLIGRFYGEEPDARHRTCVTGASAEAMAALTAYPWPGNIRELRNALFEALVYKRAGETLLLSDLPRRILRKGAARPEGMDAAQIARRIAAGGFNLRREIEAVERAALREALSHARGNAAEAARLLGEVGRGSAADPGATVRSMMRRLGVSRPRRRRS